MHLELLQGSVFQEHIEKFIKNDDKVIFIKESHHKNSKEFLKFPEHCIEGTSEALIVDEFYRYVDEDNVYKKNSTSAIFAPNFMSDISGMKNLKEVVLAGGCTDICVMNLAIPLVNYFDENDMNVKVVVPTNACDTYDAINHNRDEYNSIAYKLMDQAGVKILKKYKQKGPKIGLKKIRIVINKILKREDDNNEK